MPEPTPTPAIHNASITPNTRVRIASSTTRCSSVRPTTSSTVSAPPAARVADHDHATPSRSSPRARSRPPGRRRSHDRRPQPAPAHQRDRPGRAGQRAERRPRSAARRHLSHPRPSTSIATDTSSTSKAPHATVISAASPTSRRGPGERAITPKACPASITKPHGRRRPDDAGVVPRPERQDRERAEREHHGGRPVHQAHACRRPAAR